MFIVQITPEVQKISQPLGIGIHSFTVSSPWGEYSSFSAAEAIHTLIFVPPGTHYCGVDSKLAQGFLHLTIAARIEP